MNFWLKKSDREGTERFLGLVFGLKALTEGFQSTCSGQVTLDLATVLWVIIHISNELGHISDFEERSDYEYHRTADHGV